MGKLRLASAEIKRIDLDGDYIEVRTDMSKRDFNKLMLAMPDRDLTDESGVTPAEGIQFSKGLFAALVTDWSLDVEATPENYEQLTSESASAVDKALVEHFSSLTPDNVEVSKVSTSPAKRQKGTRQTA